MESQNFKSVPKKELFEKRTESVVRMVCEDFEEKAVNFTCVPIFTNEHTSLFTAIRFENVEALKELLKDPSIDINTLEEETRPSLGSRM